MGRRGRPKHPDVLTPREWDVLGLLREGLTNEQIAERLGVSFATARYHVSEILSKLGVSSREEAARWQPEPDRRAWWRLAWPLTAAKAGGVVLALAALVALGVLAWSVVTSDADETDGERIPPGGIVTGEVLFLPPGNQIVWFASPDLIDEAGIQVVASARQLVDGADTAAALIIDRDHVDEIDDEWLEERYVEGIVIVGARVDLNDLAAKIDRVGPNPSGSGYGSERLHYSLMYEVTCVGGGGRGTSQDFTDTNQRAQFRLFLIRLQGAIDATQCDEDGATSPRESAADVEMCRELLDSPTVPSDLDLPVLVWGQVLCWSPVDGVASYEIDLAVTYAGCTADHQSIESEPVERSVTSPADRTWLQIP